MTNLAIRTLPCLALLLLNTASAHAQVVISEFMADNKHTLADEDGQFPDWIEIENTSLTNVNLAGWSLTDDPTLQSRWVFPSTNLTAKGFMVVFASGNNRRVPGANLHTDFSLKASGEFLALLRPDSSVATEFSPTFPAQYADISYGISQNVTTNSLVLPGAAANVLVPTSGALGTGWIQNSFNDAGWIHGATGIGYETAVEGFAVYNYVANVGTCDYVTAEGVITNVAQQAAVYSENAPVINYLNTGGSSNYGNDRTFPGLTIGTDQDDFVIEATATITIPAPGDWTFGVNSDDGFSLTIGGTTMSYPDPRGPSDTLQTFTFPAAGDYPLRLIYYECGGGAEVELFAAQGSFAAWNGTDFHLVGDTAGGGLTVKAPVVSGGGGSTTYRPYIQTDLQAQMKGINATAYLRIPFNVANSASLQSLFVRMQYDDGFVAYLNGQEIARRNAPTTPQWNSTATAAHPNYQALAFEEINVTDHLNALQAGNNVLAIQGLNQNSNDTDFLIRPELVEYEITNTGTNYFAKATPGTANGSGFIAFVADTKFSVDRGFFDTPFSLAITTATAGATIRYTTNGSTPSLTNGTTYTGPVNVSGTTVIRAAAFLDGFLPSDVDTQTYVFANDVIHQSPNGETPPGWPSSWGANVVDYGMDPNVVNDPAYSGEIVNDLKSIPSYSIVTDSANLFDPVTGIYANASQDGIDWERPASIELIYPDGTAGFHVNAGLRIRGGYSRSPANPKHAFRFFFRSQYGASKLNYPAFASQGGADSFDGFDLRTFENYSWSFDGDNRFIALRDQFSRDTQLAQGEPAERGDFYHLYLNGQYWGLYNTDERAEAAYGASYFGGNKEDYDVIKVNTSAGYTIFATDGNMDAWTRLWQAATNGFASNSDYFKVQGRNVDGTPNPAYENLVDVDNLIDYMLVIFFGGNLDAPVSQFIGNTNPNNMFCVRNRTGQFGGFRFFAHDSEHTLLHESAFGTDEIHRDRTGPFPAGDPLQQGAAAALARSNPQYIFTRLTDNAEFRQRLADHVQREFFNGGPLTTEACRTRFLARSNEVYGAVAAESARWGDSKREPPFTRDVEWVTEMNRVYNDYFGQRPGIVLGQLLAKGWITSVPAPSFNQLGGNIPGGFQLTMTAPTGTIYFTLDDSDPRLLGGAVSPTAQIYGGAITLTQSARVRARTLDNGVWSGLMDATFYVIQNYSGLLVTEIMYHPPVAAGTNGDAFEFIELKNVASTNLELSGVHFDHGIQYTFPVGTFAHPGQFLVLVSDPVAFAAKYPSVHVDGVYSNNLSNSGETVSFVQADGAPIFSVNYGTTPPWPSSPDGAGFSLVPVNPNLNPDPDNALNWRASAFVGGSPGADDPPSNIGRILINEALTHTDLPERDAVELYNPNSTNVNVGNWYLTDQRTVPQKYRIPANDPRAVLPPGGYAVFTDADWNAVPGATNSFRLSSHGEEVYLYSGDANGNLTGYSDGLAFGAAENGVSFGRYVISIGEAQYPAQIVNTLGGPNAGPRVGPVVINEIQYHPAPGDDEFIELKNITSSAVNLYDALNPTNAWKISGVGYTFPTNTEIAAQGLMLVVGGDPAAFRYRYNVPAGVPIFGPYPGVLQNSGENLALQMPDHPDVDTNTGAIFIPYIDVDVVRYNDKAPWPTNADGFGPSLERLNAAAYGNDPINWRASPGPASPGLDNNGNRLPVVNAGPEQSIAGTFFPLTTPLAGFVTDDGLPNPPGMVAVVWSQVSGPGTVWFDNPYLTNAIANFPGSGTYVLRLTASDGALQAGANVTVTLSRAPSPATFLATGSVWKYLDDGSDQGTAWTAINFSDTSWKSGPAPLGYGDANGQLPATTVGYGPVATNKFITTYFRKSFSVADPAAVAGLTVSVQRDDGAVVYLNGVEVFRSNMPAGAVNYLTPAVSAVGGAEETTFYSQPVDPGLLVAGNNVLSVEIHQANGTSSDIIFDLSLSGTAFPPNTAPTANAGSDQTIMLPGNALLSGVVSDDGLPLPPGLLMFGWSKLNGPGTVTFGNPNALNTAVTFSTNGTYTLRLSVTDGSTFSSDDVVVTVEPLLKIDSANLIRGNPPTMHLHFNVTAGQSYTVHFRNAVGTGPWNTLSDLPTQPASQSVEVLDPTITNSPTRFYRLVTPQHP